MGIVRIIDPMVETPIEVHDLVNSAWRRHFGHRSGPPGDLRWTDRPLWYRMLVGAPVWERPLGRGIEYVMKCGYYSWANAYEEGMWTIKSLEKVCSWEQ